MTNSLDAPMDRHNAEKILNDALQADEFIRQNAERAIKTLIQNNFSEFVNIFGQIMLDSNTQPKIRRIASIVVKNSFHSTNSRTQRNFENNWFACPLSLRTGLVDFLEQSLNLSDQNILGNIAKILGSIVRMNMVRGETPGHFKNLYRLCSSRSYAVGVLKAVSTACNQLYDETTFEFSYEDQSAVYKISTMYLSVDIADVNLLTTTLDCLADTFEIFGKVIDEQTVREDLLYRLMACKDHGNEIVVAKTLNAINRFVDAYGNAFDDKLPYLCQMNLFTFNTCSEQICMEGFAFWELLCVMEKSELVMRFLPILLEKVLLCLTKEDPEDREWSTHKAAASLLSLLTSKYGNALLKCEVAQKFIAAKFQLLLSEEHAIGAVALGSICESGCAEYLYNVVGYLITDLGNPVCENEALFALAKICEKDLSAAFNFLPTIVDKCGVLISNHSDSSINAVWVYNAIFCSMRVSFNDDTFSLINYHYTNIIQLLLTKFGNLQSNEHDLRNALLVTLSEVIPFCPPNLNEILKSISAWLSKHIQDTLRIIEGVTREQLFIIEDVMSSYVVLLSVTLEELKAVNIQDVLDLCIQILQSLPNKAHGEVYIMVSSLLQWFVPNIKVLMPCILRDLSSRDAFISDAALNL
ncbi:importin subunit beta-1, partial [Pancytospora epiphaga]